MSIGPDLLDRNHRSRARAARRVTLRALLRRRARGLDPRAAWSRSNGYAGGGRSTSHCSMRARFSSSIDLRLAPSPMALLEHRLVERRGEPVPMQRHPLARFHVPDAGPCRSCRSCCPPAASRMPNLAGLKRIDAPRSPVRVAIHPRELALLPLQALRSSPGSAPIGTASAAIHDSRVRPEMADRISSALKRGSSATACRNREIGLRIQLVGRSCRAPAVAARLAACGTSCVWQNAQLIAMRGPPNRSVLEKPTGSSRPGSHVNPNDA